MMVKAADPLAQFIACGAAAAVAVVVLAPNPCNWERTVCRLQTPDQPDTPHQRPQGPPTLQSSGWVLGTGTDTRTGVVPQYVNNSAQVYQQDVARSQSQGWVAGTRAVMLASL